MFYLSSSSLSKAGEASCKVSSWSSINLMLWAFNQSITMLSCPIASLTIELIFSDITAFFFGTPLDLPFGVLFERPKLCRIISILFVNCSTYDYAFNSKLLSA